MVLQNGRGGHRVGGKVGSGVGGIEGGPVGAKLGVRVGSGVGGRAAGSGVLLVGPITCINHAIHSIIHCAMVLLAPVLPMTPSRHAHVHDTQHVRATALPRRCISRYACTLGTVDRVRLGARHMLSPHFVRTVCCAHVVLRFTCCFLKFLNHDSKLFRKFLDRAATHQ